MLRIYNEKTPSRRFASRVVRPKKVERIKGMTSNLQKHSGRSRGKISVRHQGGRHARYYREVDFKRNKFGINGEVVRFEYDPNRNVDIALIKYSDGEYRYILAPKGLAVGETVVSNEKAEIKVGNTMKLRFLPVGTYVHNVEMIPGKGGQLARSAGTAVVLQSKEEDYGHLKMPSGEVRMVALDALATIGVLTNEDVKNEVLGKAGRSRHMGVRPAVRGTAMDPESHPHGGGEGRSGIGRKKPMTKYGRPAVGKTRKKNKWTDRYIMKRRTA